MLHGAQLWVALPDAQRDAARRRSTTTRDLPVLAEPRRDGDGAARRAGRRPLAGSACTRRWSASTSTLASGARRRLPLEPDFEHAVLTVSGAPEVDGGALEPGVAAATSARGRGELPLRADDAEPAAAARRDPFAEKIVMWWNFVARTGEEIAAARERGRQSGGEAEAGRGSPRPRPASGPAVRRRDRFRGSGARGSGAARGAAAPARTCPLRCLRATPAAAG